MAKTKHPKPLKAMSYVDRKLMTKRPKDSSESQFAPTAKSKIRNHKRMAGYP